MTVLALTSPHMRGNHVEHAQLELRANGFYEGAIDAEYGPVTAGATREAKYRLGYTTRNLNDRYGPALDDLLTGKTKPNPAMRARALTRRREDDTAGEQHALQVIEFMGLTENPPGSNRVEGITDWYGITGPWCAMGQTRAGINARLTRTFRRGERWAYCPYIVRDAENGLHGLRLVPRQTTIITPGMLALFDWAGDGVADHIGCAVPETWLETRAPDLLADARHEHVQQIGRATLRQGEFWCAEMNTSFTDDSNGGEAVLRIRHRNQLRALIRITR